MLCIIVYSVIDKIYYSFFFFHSIVLSLTVPAKRKMKSILTSVCRIEEGENEQQELEMLNSCLHNITLYSNGHFHTLLEAIDRFDLSS